MTKPSYYWGIDCGSAFIKIALLNSKGQLLATHNKRTLFPLLDHVIAAVAETNCPESPFNTPNPQTPKDVNQNHIFTATGYGRHKISFAQKKITEIKAHQLGAINQTPNCPKDFTLIDIGGQDSKIIEVRNLKVDSFVMNRKCAAGTGAFIEELAHRLAIPIEELDSLARKKDKEMRLNSYCTVFAVQEMIKILMGGEKIENLAFALYRSIVKRVLEIAPMESNNLLLSGGVIKHNPILIDLFKTKLPSKSMSLANNSQSTGAIGAAFLLHKKSLAKAT